MKIVIGRHCPQCGALIYVPIAWWGTNPPPNEYTCHCIGQSKQSTQSVVTTGTGDITNRNEK